MASSEEAKPYDLSGRKIKGLTTTKIPSTTRMLILRKNMISQLPARGDFANILRNLITLDLSYNRLSDIHALALCSNLESLDLSHNQLRRVTCLETLVSLEVLDLSHNAIDNFLTIRAIALTPRLAHLSMKGNPVCDSPKFGPTVRSQLCRLQTLDGALARKGAGLASFSPGPVKLSPKRVIAQAQAAENRAAVGRSVRLSQFDVPGTGRVRESRVTGIPQPTQPSAPSGPLEVEDEDIAALDALLQREREALARPLARERRAHSTQPNPTRTPAPAPTLTSASEDKRAEMTTPTPTHTPGVPSFVQRLHMTHTRSSIQKRRPTDTEAPDTGPIAMADRHRSPGPGRERERAASRGRTHPTHQRVKSSPALTQSRRTVYDDSRSTVREPTRSPTRPSTRPDPIRTSTATLPRPYPSALRACEELSRLEVIAPPPGMGERQMGVGGCHTSPPPHPPPQAASPPSPPTIRGSSGYSRLPLHAQLRTHVPVDQPPTISPAMMAHRRDVSQPIVTDPPSPVGSALTSLRAGSVALSAQMSVLRNKIRGLEAGTG